MYHAWLSGVKPSKMVLNGLKFHRLDLAQRGVRRAEWNHPVVWPTLLILMLLVLGTLPALRTWRAREHARA